MAAIEITPAGNQLYEARVRDGDGESRHEIAVPDPLVARMDTGGVSMRHVVLAAVEFLAGREGRENLDATIDLGEVAERYEGFEELIPSRARELATVPDEVIDPPEGQAPPSGDERLLDEVVREQRDGDVTPPDEKL